MDTTLHEISPVEYELKIEVPADEMAEPLDKALREQRRRVDLKGFRKGKVPLQIVRRMFGRELAFGVAEQKVREAFEEEVEEKDYKVLGQPEITQLDHELGEKLEATIRFGVRPPIELADLSEHQIDRLKHEITDEDVEKELDKLRRENADLAPLGEDEAIGEEDFIVFDVQELDAETDAPVIGQRDEDQQLFLDDEVVEQNPMLGKLKEAVVGQKPGATVRFSFEHEAAHGGHAHHHAHRFEAVVKEAKRRDLPELDDEFADEATEGQVETMDELREEVRKGLERAWERQTREFIEGTIVEKMIELHPVPVPRQAVQLYLDSFVEDVKKRNDDELPENFDERAFRAQNTAQAEQQARWMLLRDYIVEQSNLEVTEEDLDQFFEEQGGGGLPVAQMRQFYEQMPELLDQVRFRLLSQKVFDHLTEQFQVNEKDLETLESEARDRAEARKAEQQEAAEPEEEETAA